MKKFNRRMTLLIVLVLTLPSILFSCKKITDDGITKVLQSNLDFTLTNVVGVDSYGRGIEAIKRINSDLDVGMFYFALNGNHSDDIYDITKIMNNNPADIWDSGNNAISPMNKHYYWGEPLYGYYHNADKWVLSKHVEMFTMAKIDFLGVDVTNSYTYDETITALFETLEKYREQGFNPPKVMFITNTNSQETTKHLYNTYYKGGKFSKSWYSPNGKPMIAGYKFGWSEEDAHIAEFFDMKTAQWPDKTFNANSFPWMSFEYPQRSHNGIMSVAVAQHTSSKMSNQAEGNWGRGFDFATMTDRRSEFRKGINFENQWKTALEGKSKRGRDKVNSVFVTGWNEWTAIKFADAQKKVFFVDLFNEEFSRDIEPMKGGYEDNFYLQTMRNINEFKGESVIGALEQDPFERLGSFKEFEQVKSKYLDFAEDVFKRDFKGAAPTLPNYTDDTNRNDIESIKVDYDKSNIYFQIACNSDITEYEAGDKKWMNVVIVTSDGEYVVNRSVANGAGSVEKKVNGDYVLQSSCVIDITGNLLVMKVPRGALGITDNVRFRFKVADNIDISNNMNFYLQGDSAPIGNLFYNFG